MRKRFHGNRLVLLALVAGLVTCGPALDATTPAAEPSPEQSLSGAQPRATEVPSSAWNQLLSQDAIRPIYDPEFVPASEAGYNEDDLVMGIALEDEAKAYPVSLLNSREMVNDELAGTPILVTW